MRNYCGGQKWLNFWQIAVFLLGQGGGVLLWGSENLADVLAALGALELERHYRTGRGMAPVPMLHHCAVLKP